MEIWKDIKGYEGFYKVSNYGNVKSITRYKKQLKPCIDKDGYRTVQLKRNNTSKHFRIARLVATAFISNAEGKEQVNHIDTNKENDNVKNLEWCTAQENVQHSLKLGHYKGINRKPVAQLYANKIIKIWDSMSDASKALNIPVSNISKCINGERKKAGKYTWVIITPIQGNDK